MGNIKTPYDRVFIKTDEEITLPEKQALVGRLEKFLYAICAFDFDDLPIPQSRIEKFVFALISNEIPDIVPQSRAEKFLLAYLTGDTSDLPEPQSRIELLLNNLVFGIQDISNVETIQSRYELLMAYLVQHKEGSNVDYEYVLYDFSEENYVLYNTAEKPIKSAILKGNTLVNHVSLVERNLSAGNSISSDGYITVTANSGYSNAFLGCNAIKESTEYLCVLDIKEYTANSTFRLTSNHTTSIFNKKETIPQGSTGIHKFIFTTISDTDAAIYSFRSYLSSEATSGYIIYRVMLIEYQEGMENWDIPYFEGMQSVQMPVLTTSNEDNTKSTTLSCNEEVELRGIGDVKDELDLLTGELTQCIGEVVFDGSEDESYTVNNSSETGLFTCFEINSMQNKLQSVDETVTDDLLSDKVSSISHYNYLKDVEGFHNKTWTSTGASRLFLNLPNEKTNGTVEGLRVYLNSNPITLQYPLAEKVIKTVDISVVDQNGNEAELSSFEDITHVTVTSEGILPDVELSVANQFEEDLTTLSLRMNNIATTQEGLEESVDEQTMEVDSTMMATTEIYEGLL